MTTLIAKDRGMVPYIYSDKGILTVFLGGKNYQISNTSENFKRVFDEVLSEDTDEAQLISLLDFKKKTETFVHNDISIRDGVLFYKTIAVNNSLTNRIVKMIEENIPAATLVNFLENLFLNPSRTSIMELYDFLQHRALPITPDGCFLAYKAVRHNYTSKTASPSGEFLDNSIGKCVQVERWYVDDNRREGCSYGLHAGTIEYAKSFANSDDRIVLVKVNPKDVVSVPLDSGCQKLRCCGYLVLSDYVEDITSSVYPPPEDDPYDDDDDEDDDWYDSDEDEWDDEEDSVETKIVKRLRKFSEELQ